MNHPARFWSRRWLCSRLATSTLLTLALSPATGFASSGDITAAAVGGIYNYNSLQGREVPPGVANGPSSGDNWESCWGADNTLFVVHDDGRGFGHGVPGTAPFVPGPIKPDQGGIAPNVNHGLCRVDGDPNAATESVRGINLNPGIYSYTLPTTYSRDVYEVDGVLYAVKLYSNQRDKGFDRVHFDFFNVSLMKSPDGGRNWYNHLGQTNAPPPNNRAQCMFPDPRMSWPAFVHYGKGGNAPAIDNAQKYVYVTSYDRFGRRAGDREPRGVYLARIPRATLVNLDKNDVQYFKGGDGMKDAGWSKSVEDARPMLEVPHVSPKIVYNYGSQRYVMCNEFTAGVQLWTARHPWGPWTKLLDHSTPGAYWGSLACNKWTSADGKKMWYIATGAYRGKLYPYGFLFNALYLSHGEVDAYEAASAERAGPLTVAGDPSPGEQYVSGFGRVGDGLGFTIRKIHGKGWHIVRFQYASTNQGGNSVSVFVNGRKVRRIDKLSHTGPAITQPQRWLDYSGIYYLNDGANTFEIRQDEGDAATGLCIRRLYASREATYDEGENIALNAAATASFVAPGSTAGAVNDGCAGGGANEWISKHEASGCWVQLDWKKPVTIHKIVCTTGPIRPIA
jgi:hypothetical protein